MAERIHAGDFDSKVLADGTFALVDFYSDSCVPCKRMSPVLAELEESYAGKLYVRNSLKNTKCHRHRHWSFLKTEKKYSV